MSTPSTPSTTFPETTLCRLCNYNACDLRLGCGCSLHARCMPLRLLTVGFSSPFCSFCGNQHNITTTSTTANDRDNTKPSIYIAPLSFDGLEHSIALRTDTSNQMAMSLSSNNDPASSTTDNINSTTDQNNNSKKRNHNSMLFDSSGAPSATDNNGNTDVVNEDTFNHATYVVYCQGRRPVTSAATTSTTSASSTAAIDDELHRTGRWNDEEVEFVDHLVSMFDKGLLPLANGTKLSVFLGDMLLCKASRLTKKMKNAKLSSRSFTMSPSTLQQGTVNHNKLQEDARMLSGLQEQFILSLPSLSAQLEMRFNLSKQWRTYLTNFCVETEYPSCDVSQWFASLEEYEDRALQAEAQIRSARRRRITTSCGNATNDTGTTTTTSSSNMSNFSSTRNTNNTTTTPPIITSMVDDNINTMDAAEEDMALQSLGLKADSNAAGPITEDFESAMRLLMGADDDDDDNNNLNFFDNYTNSGLNDKPFTDIQDWSTAGNPFLAAIAEYLEERNLPFQYVDCWVPSFTHGDGMDDEVRLLPAGYVTRDDLQDDDLSAALLAFGEYSKSFSFKPGRGLPGRVYVSGTSQWQLSLNETHPSVFARAGGAKFYGLKTAAAIPFSAPGVGRMIVVLYSTERLPEDLALTNQCAAELSKFSPQPHWKLVIDLGDGNPTNPTSSSMEDLNVGSFNPNTFANNVTMNSNESTVTSLSDDLPTEIYRQTSGHDQQVSDDTIERKLITLLGDQMPAFHAKQSGQSTSAFAEDMQEALPSIMRMRLLLLRPQFKRSAEDNDVIDVLNSSFKNYTEESKRSDSEIAILLAREWQCLQSVCSFSPAQQPRTSVSTPSPVFEDVKIPPSATGQATITPGSYATNKALIRPTTTMGMNSFKPIEQNNTNSSSMLSYDHSKIDLPSVRTVFEETSNPLVENEDDDLSTSLNKTRRVSVSDQLSAFARPDSVS